MKARRIKLGVRSQKSESRIIIKYFSLLLLSPDSCLLIFPVTSAVIIYFCICAMFLTTKSQSSRRIKLRCFYHLPSIFDGGSCPEWRRRFNGFNFPRTPLTTLNPFTGILTMVWMMPGDFTSFADASTVFLTSSKL